ncbi:hypothetical protein PFICI_10118 [Pestalotiopsis fici W106-1]|uniref:Heterokaryon incompatibility domain-containing protein n=1 Tax=Pestalotiopsis fici (strain W106-1 / CGMCC3.15140) TaxID=1229662 RepID=W3WYT4_PESFW|nr:uncharacterized protein PFICI_10118 [Pestalotiopsis fici W106-1]ETS78056.1 hypothetical protein PFICI_10118 [Pestalotiopsis fici W106-1]
MSDATTASDSPEDDTSEQLTTTAAAASRSDLTDLYQRRGAKATKALGKARKERKYDKNVLSGRDLERLTIRPNDGESEERIVAKATQEQRDRFGQYKHYSFVKEWTPLSDKGRLDDEWFITDPEVLPEDDPGYLCEMCRHLNFEAMFTQRELPGNSVPSMPTRINLHGLWKIMQGEGNTCAFCGLLRRKIIEGGKVDPNEEDGIKDGQFFINVIDEGPKYCLRLEIEVEVEGMIVDRFVIQRIEQDSQQPLAGRIVQQDQADMGRLRQWLHICEETHHSTENSLESHMVSLRVIDTDEFRVREVDAPFRYACLSYVWGDGSQVQYTTTTRDGLEALNGLREVSLPPTIQDAIKVVKEAGLRYLWVDALCILQDDPEDKGKIIPKMGPIYSSATLTIIASAHANPHEGLPGIGTADRSVAQDVAKFQGMTLAVGLHDPRQPILDIEGSAWNSRAWTFQEQALSARSVHFTRSQMVFKCIHCAVMLEETVPTPDPAFQHSAIENQAKSDIMSLLWSHSSLGRFPNKGFTTRDAGSSIMFSEDIDMQAYYKMPVKEQRKIAPVFDIIVDSPRGFMGSLTDTDDSTPWDLYRNAVDDYTKRKLSFESDAVNAFAGVEHLVRRGINTKFWSGLPSFAFEQALLWHAREPLERRVRDNRVIFPSWSWAGWRGSVSYHGRGWKNSILWDSVSVIRWFVRETPAWFMERFKEEERTEEEIRDYQEKLDNARLLLRELNIYDLRFVNGKDKDGWVVKHDEVYNRHIYCHDAYPGVRFTYPVALPGQDIADLPDMNDVLLFHAHVVPIVPCDMEKTASKMKLEDQFMQLGINDESRSANYRPAWQRIVYHQGYRAGFLILNDEDLPAVDDGYEYHLAAITRGSLPHVPPPPGGWDSYWNIEPRIIQDFIFDEEWNRGPSTVIVPREEAEPYSRPRNEDGDPHWDHGRFNGVGVFDVYEVLLLMTRNGISRRIGAGKINYCAFGAACPEDMFVKLF